MSFGLRVRNPGLDLVVDNNAMGLVYVGRPWLVQSGSYDTSGINRKWNFFHYRVDSLVDDVPPVIAATLQQGVAVQVESVQKQPGTARTWDVRVYSAIYGSYLVFNEPAAPELFAFSAPAATPQGSFGIAIRNAGVLRWDLSRRPLWIRQIAGLALLNNGNAGAPGFTESSFGLIGGLVKPALAMSTGGFWQSTNGVTERHATGSHGWTRDGSSVYRRPVLHISEPGFGGSLPFPSYSLLDTFAVVIDAANLP